MKETLETFIKKNHLSFAPGCRNTDLTIICGFALYLEGLANYKDYDAHIELRTVLKGYASKDSFLRSEFERVFDYARDNNYGNWWKKAANKAEYILD